MCVLLVMAMTATYTVAAPIHDAAGKGNLAKVKALLKKTPKLVNLADKEGATPLHYATSGNHKSVVELLLSKNANANAKKKNGVTPLHIAAAMGRTEIAKLLLAKGAKVDAVDNKDRTPISLAETNGHTAVVELLNAESAKPTSAIAPGTKIGDVCVNPKDGAEMVWVPAGEFLMGSTDEEIAVALKECPIWKAEWFENEKPQRKVYMDGYWMYKYEVTVAQYRKFCEATKREMPKAETAGWIDNHPMVYVFWQDAADYAKWAGASLPTEAQWEKAARGTDGQIYPWGNKWPPPAASGNFADESFTKKYPDDAHRYTNGGEPQISGYDDGYADMAPVGKFPAGASPYGAMDMAGNAWEWCADWSESHQNDYKNAPTKNPTGPLNAVLDSKGRGFRVTRGGGFLNGVCYGYSRCAKRQRVYTAERFYDSGFRCARTP